MGCSKSFLIFTLCLVSCSMLFGLVLNAPYVGAQTGAGVSGSAGEDLGTAASAAANAAATSTSGTGLQIIGKLLGDVGRIGWGTSRPDLPVLIGKIISIFLGLLGIIFIALIVYGGYLWMTAMGDETKIEKAKNTIVPALIGVVIIIAAYSITSFVISSLVNAVQNK